MNLARVFQFLLGSTLGLGILALAVLGGGYLLVQQLSAPPPKPIFDNEGTVGKTTPSPTPTASPSPQVTPEPSPSPEGKLATVEYGEGLSVRDNPSADAARIGGVEYQEEVRLLEESADQQWQRIRSESTGVEGWVKAGNLKLGE